MQKKAQVAQRASGAKYGRSCLFLLLSFVFAFWAYGGTNAFSKVPAHLHTWICTDLPVSDQDEVPSEFFMDKVYTTLKQFHRDWASEVCTAHMSRRKGAGREREAR